MAGVRVGDRILGAGAALLVGSLQSGRAHRLIVELTGWLGAGESIWFMPSRSTRLGRHPRSLGSPRIRRRPLRRPARPTRREPAPRC